MRILFLAHRIPYPPNKGEKIRAFHELEFLRSHGHSVDVFALVDDPEEAEFAEGLRSHCSSVSVARVGWPGKFAGAAGAIVSGRPLSLPFFYSRELAGKVREALRQFSYDALFVYSTAMMQYVPRDTRVPILLDFVDADSSKWRQYAGSAAFPLSLVYSREASLLNRYELESARRSRHCFFVSEKEIRAAGMQEVQNVSAVENGVVIPSPDSSAGTPARQPYVAFVGQMNYRPNTDAVVWFAGEILPLIRLRRPEVRFVIVGREPSPEVTRLARLAGVEVTGEVREVVPYIRGAAAVVAPFRISQGIHNKMLEALAAGVPIVSTPPAVEAIRPSLRAPILVAENAQDFASAVLRVLVDDQYRTLAKENVSRVESEQSWTATLRPIEHILKEVTGGPSVSIR